MKKPQTTTVLTEIQWTFLNKYFLVCFILWSFPKVLNVCFLAIVSSFIFAF